MPISDGEFVLSYTYATVFLLALLLSRAAAPFVAQIAITLGAVDLPSARKVHRGVVPRLGGLAVVIGVLVPLGILLLADTDVAREFRSESRPLFGLLLGLVPILLLGVLDDIRGTSAFVKFPVQILAGAIAYAFGCRIEQVSSPIGSVELELGVLAPLATVFWFVVVTNAINLIDGLDGLATGIVAFVAGTLFALSNANDHIAVATVSLALCGAAVGFLRYNFPPATIFLGDTGSLATGYLIAGVAVMGAQKSSAAVALFVPIIVLGVPLFDTVTSFWRRLLRLRHPFRADAEHIHHRLLARGNTHRDATLILYAVTGVLTLLALLVAYFDSRGSLRPMGWTMFATAAFLLTVGGILGYLNVAELRVHTAAGFRHRRLRRRRQRLLEAFLQRLSGLRLPAQHVDAMTTSEAWDALTEQLELLELDAYQLHVHADNEPVRSHGWQGRFEPEAVHSRAVMVDGRLRAQLVVARPGCQVARAHDAEMIDEVLHVFVRELALHDARDAQPEPGVPQAQGLPTPTES